jgi:vacuolar-type H+-ATPase subunit H
LSSQKTIAHILSIEQEAVGIHDDAEHRAKRIIEEAKKTASDAREKALEQAHKQAGQIVATGQEAAKAQQERITAQAEAEAQHMEEIAAPHFDRAVQFVLDQVAGRE